LTILLLICSIGILSIFSIIEGSSNIFMLIAFLIINFIMFFYMLSFISVLGFWLVQMWPIRPIFNAMFAVLGGTLFPLDLLPENIFRWLQYNPFSLLNYGSTKALQNLLFDSQLLFYVTASIIWMIIFRVLYQILWTSGLKKYEGMGA